MLSESYFQIGNKLVITFDINYFYPLVCLHLTTYRRSCLIVFYHEYNDGSHFLTLLHSFKILQVFSP